MNPFFFGLFHHRPFPVPTLRAFFLTALIIFATGVFAVKNVHSFLAVNDPAESGALVIEGWAPDYAFAAAVVDFKNHHYDKLYVTGGPIERGAPLSEYRTYAELGEAILLRMGMERGSVQAVPAPEVHKDRTYASALALRDLFHRDGNRPSQINLISMGVHARRSRLLFEKAFGPGTKVGVLAIEDQNYNPSRWWKYSQGVRSVTDELLAYCYARLLFSPDDL
jgi:hypothetical protein